MVCQSEKGLAKQKQVGKPWEALIKNLPFLKINSRFLFDSNQCFHIFSRFLAENCEKRITR